MAIGDYCPRCLTTHDILRDCPPVVEPGVPVPRSISRDLLDAQAEIQKLNLQNDELRRAHNTTALRQSEKIAGLMLQIEELKKAVEDMLKEMRAGGTSEFFKAKTRVETLIEKRKED